MEKALGLVNITGKHQSEAIKNRITLLYFTFFYYLCHN